MGSPRRYGELSEAEVVNAALAFCEREGLAQLTMRKLATELGLSSMSSYYYVASKQVLFDLVADRVLGQVPEPPPSVTGWEAQLTFLFRGARRVLLQYPGVSDHLLVRATGRSRQLRLHRLLHEILAEAGFDRPTADATSRVLAYLLFGAVSQELATAAASDRDDIIRFTDDEEVFDFGLEVMVDGLRARRREQGATGTS
jgi:AcrR family transcriptional regulator